MSPPNFRNVTEAELAVLQALWSFGLATIREIRDEVYPGGSTSEYSTVQKLLERLEAKDLVRRSRRTVPHAFAPKVDRDVFVERKLVDLADSVCQGSMAPIVSNLLRIGRLSASDRQALRALVEDAPKAQKPKRGKR